MVEKLDPRHFDYFVITTRNIYRVMDLTETSAQGKRTLESRRFLSGRGIRKAGHFAVTFWKRGSIVFWQCGVRFEEKIKCVKIVLSPIPEGVVVAGNGRKKMLAEGEKYQYTYPLFENPGSVSLSELHSVSNFLQVLLVEHPNRSVSFIDAFELPPRIKRFQIGKRGGELTISIILEELACHWSSSFQTPICRFEMVQNWEQAASKICVRLEKNLGLVPFEKRRDVPSWAKRISLVVNLDGIGYFGEQNHNLIQATKRLNEVSGLFPPEETLICMAGFMGRFDHSSASFEPEKEIGGRQGFHKFMEVAHNLGFHIVVLGNIHGIGSDLRKKYADLVEQAQERQSNGDFCFFGVDWDGDGLPEVSVYYVSPGNARWRSILVNGISSLVEKYGIHGYFLDQTCVFTNDPRYNRYQGMCSIIGELRRRYPELLVAGELMNDYLMPLTPFGTEHPPIQDETYHPLKDWIFNRYTRRFMHLLIYSPDNKWGAFPQRVCLEPVSRKNQKSLPEAEVHNNKYDIRWFKRGILPTLMLSNWTVDLKCAAAKEIIQLAHQYRETIK